MSDNSRFDPTPYTAGASPGIRQGEGGGGQNLKAFFFIYQFLGGGRPLAPPLDTRLYCTVTID